MSETTCTTCGGSGQVPYHDAPTGETKQIQCFGCDGSGRK